MKSTHYAWLTFETHGAELDRAFNKLPGGPTARNPRSGEAWQYMGSEQEAESGIWWHSFRHRDFPYRATYSERRYWWVRSEIEPPNPRPCSPN